MKTICVLLILLTSGVLYSKSTMSLNPSRRRDQFLMDFGYFIYPIAVDVPGMGTSYGAGGTAVNMFKTDADITAFYLRGDFDATGAALLNIHLLPKFLIFDTSYYDYRAATMQFDRGINSDKNAYILPETEGNATVSQLTISLFERKFELYGRYSYSKYKLNRVMDKDGNEFSNVNKDTDVFKRGAAGFKFDFTDDRQDPRNGLRLEMEATKALKNQDDVSEFYNLDSNVTLYFPILSHSTWGFNVFNSRAIITKEASTDENYLREKIGLNCSQIADAALQAQCQVTENKLISERIALNRYGLASSLGGTQRLRSYPNGRFAAGHAMYFGTEFRWNLTDENTLMDYIILRGVRTSIQLAFFAETGTVVEEPGDYFKKKYKGSYGAGLRIVFSGVTLRFDFANGSEGFESQMFLDYPWSLYAIDDGV